MEQRAPGHTVLDDKIYRRGLLDFKARHRGRARGARLRAATPRPGRSASSSGDGDRLRRGRSSSPRATRTRRAEPPRRRRDPGPPRRAAEDRRGLPPRAGPRRRATSTRRSRSYWFCHLAVITELNGWDAFNPGHLDQHLRPFYERGLADGTLTREDARELLECFFVKFNNHPAPPKVGVTAAESGTYTDFANINLGGLLARRRRRLERACRTCCSRSSTRCTCCSPARNLQLSRKTPDALLKHTPAGHPQGLRLPLALQRRRRRRGAAAAGQDARGRARRRLHGLRRDRGLRQGGLHPHRLLQPAEGAGAGPARRRRPAHRRAARAATGAPGALRLASTTCSRRSRRSCATSSTSRSRGNQLIERCTRG